MLAQKNDEPLTKDVKQVQKPDAKSAFGGKETSEGLMSLRQLGIPGAMLTYEGERDGKALIRVEPAAGGEARTVECPLGEKTTVVVEKTAVTITVQSVRPDSIEVQV